MPVTWDARGVGVADASVIIGMPRKHLDVLVCGHGAYFSEKDGRRWLSAADITVVLAARRLSACGVPLRRGVPLLARLLSSQPDEDAYLAVQSGPAFTSTIASDLDEAAQLAAKSGALILPLGKLAAAVVADIRSITKEAQ